MYLYTRTSRISEKKGKNLLFGCIRHLVCLGNERRDSSPCYSDVGKCYTSNDGTAGPRAGNDRKRTIMQQYTYNWLKQIYAMLEFFSKLIFIRFNTLKKWKECMWFLFGRYHDSYDRDYKNRCFKNFKFMFYLEYPFL
jgi:hypothetical protein